MESKIMLGKHRKGSLSSAPSLQSIASSSDLSIREESLPNPATLAECDDQFETYQILIKGKMNKKTDLVEQLKHLKLEKEPLFKVKSALQEEISSSNHLINLKSEEVTQIKHKLRHHSEKQIQDNIDRLEFQLRNNNYKPREEQKILDEISLLKRSFKTLNEFELKQIENKKYRSERGRLIDQRNEVFSKIQAIIFQEEEIRREINELKRVISSTKKSIEHLESIRPAIEEAHLEDQRRKEEFRINKQKEKTRLRKEQFILRQQERQKRWQEYEASRGLYEEEKDLCKMLIAYLISLLPNDSLEGVESKVSLSRESIETRSETKCISPGKFYSKPKDNSPERMTTKKRNSKYKKKQKANKVKDLSHPPDVLSNLGFLNISIPRTTGDVQPCLESVQKTLEHYEALEKIERISDASEAINRMKSEESTSSQATSIDSVVKKSVGNISNAISSGNLTEKNSSFSKLLKSPNKVSHHSLVQMKVKNENVLHESDKNELTSTAINASAAKSFFSVSIPLVRNSEEKSKSSLGPTYASVAAKLRV